MVRGRPSAPAFSTSAAALFFFEDSFGLGAVSSFAVSPCSFGLTLPERAAV
jgi:hypothetical protein